MKLTSYAAPIEKPPTALKWLPYQPAESRSDGGVVTAEGQVPVDSGRARRDGAFGDPFQDGSKADWPAPIKQVSHAARKVAYSASSSFADELPDAPPPGGNSAQQWRAAGSGNGSTPATPPNLTIEKSDVTRVPLHIPTLEQHLAERPEPYVEKCPTVGDLKPISKITDDIRPPTPEVPTECSLGSSRFRSRTWRPTTYAWTAAATCNKPLYFEQPQVERYGHSWGPRLQPILSGADFYARIPFVPYMLAMDPPWECQYDLGYYRPGSCAPYMLDPLPLSVRGAVAEATFWTGLPLAF